VGVQDAVWLQSTIGFQKQLSAVMGVDADLTYLHEYNLERGRDPNLLYILPLATILTRRYPAGRTRVGTGSMD